MSKTCLLLEDDFVLRSTMETLLRDLGVTEVAAFAEAEDALAFLTSVPRPGFAVIDYRLGRFSTSEQVAQELVRLGVPMAFATGLGELPEISDTLTGVPVLGKPVRREDLQPLLVRAGLLAD